MDAESLGNGYMGKIVRAYIGPKILGFSLPHKDILLMWSWDMLKCVHSVAQLGVGERGTCSVHQVRKGAGMVPLSHRFCTLARAL